MNEPSPYAPQPYQPANHRSARPSAADEMTSTAKNIWATRPVRIPSDQGSKAMVAGVCEGIGARYQVDPTLIRVGFVVGTIAGGAGIPAYLAMWGLMPRYSKTTSPFEDAFRNDSSRGSGEHDDSEAGTGWALGIIGGLMLISGVAATGGALLLTAAVLGGSLYLLHKRKPLPPAGLLAVEQPTSDDAVDLSMYSPVEGYPVPPGRTEPPAWDPLGAAPDLWNLNEPAPREEAKPRKKGRGLLTAGLITACAAVAAVGLFGITLNVNSMDLRSNVGSTTLAPASVSALQDDLETGVGSQTIDLTQVKDFDSLNSSQTIDVETGVGSVTITVPEDAPVTFECEAGVGSSNCEEANTYVGDGHLIEFDISTGVGSITVERVPA